MIDVIIPVYRGARQTRECIESVLAAPGRVAFNVVVVEDASPEPELVAWLLGLASEGSIELLRNSSNLGFVKSVNQAMGLHRERDVVLLNSDTQVANDWLDRLHRCAYSAEDIATVTPFSNNATICSYPFEGWEGVVPGALGLEKLDALFARTLKARTADLPTAVGFCMYIRRACLEQLGLFDAEAFGRGYGEENEFCRRAARHGWRNMLAADVFVLHHGAVSFGADRFELMQAAERALLERHPDYNDLVGSFIAADPLRELRRDIDRARLAMEANEALSVLEERHLELEMCRARLRHLLHEAPAQGAEAVPLSMQELWNDFLAEGRRRLSSTSRWGPLRRRLFDVLLRSLQTLTGSRSGQ